MNEALTNFYKRFILKDPVAIFYSKRVNRLKRYNIPKGKLQDRLLLITTAYNNSNVIRHQIKLVTKNLKDKHTYIVVDNSPDINKREEIKNICLKNNVGYISLHNNPFITGSGSDSHAIVLNWAFKHLVLKYRPSYFGFIDHDIYPISPNSIVEKLNLQPFYGLLQERLEYWYLWAGFCFFTAKFYQENSLDFMAGVLDGVSYDTGGAIYHKAYNKYEKNSMLFPLRTYENIREGDIFQSDKVEIIGDWLHSFNGSYWMKVNDKEDILDRLLEKYEDITYS